MKEETKKLVRETILKFAKGISEVPFTVDELKRAFPFHTIFFPDNALISFKQQRSLVTKMGMQLYPKIAKIIAEDQYKEVHKNHGISGSLDIGKINVIDKIINELRGGKRKPNFEEEMKEISASEEVEDLQDIRIIGDLFVGDFRPGPLFLEIKSPRPNLDVCAESKKKMLFFREIFSRNNPQAFLAFPYNPFVHKEKYAHAPTKKIMDINTQVLVAEEMWNKLGGNKTYEKLLEIIEEVKKLRRKE